ncbi:Gamma-tubulin complex component 6 [Eumeta japonica]|uniref:Gamma-tubulin complex component 6 n=1 Tax=Eumeta variegata TaxID=151549 RepID=A0A4C1V8L9_EUMVA|nr:Gamma-tubulin complex component 6 [Eumeta japonica]
MSPSIASWSETGKLPYIKDNLLDFPRLTAPRDLQLPSSETQSLSVKEPVFDTCFKVGMKKDSKANSIDIWEIASQIDKDMPDDIWETVVLLESGSCYSTILLRQLYFGSKDLDLIIVIDNLTPPEFTVSSLRFIERFIFEGELDDRYHEFFIRKDSQYVNSHSKKYWDKGFHISQSVTVPEFLKVLAKYILLCGKSLRLLKLCNPNDPLVVLISTNHPTVKCCWNLEELENQQQILDVYRTRCLFVCGEPATFQQILLKRDAEKKAFTEMASQKQAETMEKIMAERKRLAQLIVAEKQHSLRVLEAAIAETKAAKNKSKRRERLKTELELEAEKAREGVDSKLKDMERNKMLAYYSKLNMEVEKSKIHTEWKIKRLQLDEARMQLLSSEERNLKRERLELEHQQNELMSESVASDSNLDNENVKAAVNITVQPHEKSNLNEDLSDIPNEHISDNGSDIAINKTPPKSDVKKRNSSEVFNVIYNAAKNIFGFKSDEICDVTKCDNMNQFDTQGNVLESPEVNSNTLQEGIGEQSCKSDEEKRFTYSHLDITRHEALKNKEKSMSHNVILTDIENNEKKISIVDAENNLPTNNRSITNFDEAERNKMKVLGTELGNISIMPQKIAYEARTEAQKEAFVNKQKVLGVEYNLPAKVSNLKVPANIAQEEAFVNKQKVLGVEYNLPAKVSNLKVPANIAQEEAFVNKQKVLGVEYNLPAKVSNLKVPANIAQEEAFVNKQKVMGVEYNLPAKVSNLKVPANIAQEEAFVNKQKVLGVEYNLPAKVSNLKVPANIAQEEAFVNKQKVLGVEYNLPAKVSNLKVPANIAQEEAFVNKQKVMGVEYNIPSDAIPKRTPITEAQEKALLNKQKIMGVECGQAFDIIKQQPANDAQEEALRNRKKILDSGLNFLDDVTIRAMPAKRAGLTLDLKSVADNCTNKGQFSITPNTGAVTPAEFFPRLDLETPTTAEAPFDGQITNDPFSPNNNENKDQDSTNSKSDKDYLSPKGFNFSTLIPDEEEAESGDNFDSQINTSTESSPTKSFLNTGGVKDSLSMRALWNTEDDYDFEDFDPFGVKELKLYSDDYFNKKMDLTTNNSCYTHPAVLMKELQKSPHENMFATYFTSKDVEDPKVTCDNIAILTACLQRSVMLPLTYQLEVVNNSILTHFLVHLDMYEHLKSLKDYFFLMDGINKFSENLSFTISEAPLSFHHSSPDVLQCLSLTYEIVKITATTVNPIDRRRFPRGVATFPSVLAGLLQKRSPTKVTAFVAEMAFMMPVVKNDWDIYNSQRSRRTSEAVERSGPGRVRKVSESRSEGPMASPRTAALSPHRSAPAMRSLSYCRAPPSRASLRAGCSLSVGDSPARGSGSPAGTGNGSRAAPEKFHSRLVEKLKRALGRADRAEERSS